MNSYTQVLVIHHFQLHHHHHYLYWFIFTPFFNLNQHYIFLWFIQCTLRHIPPNNFLQKDWIVVSAQCCENIVILLLGNFDVAKIRQDLAESIAKGKTLKKQKLWKQCSACNVTCKNDKKGTGWDFDVILPRFLMTCLLDKFHFFVGSLRTFGCLDIDHEYFHRASCTQWLVMLQCVAPRDFVSLRIFRFSSLWFFISFISYVSISRLFLFTVLFHLMWKTSQFYVIGSSIKFHFFEVMLVPITQRWQ